MIATDLKTGVIYQEDGQPWQVEKYSHHKTARSGATVKVFVRNLITGETRQKNYLGNNKVEDAFVERKNVQYLYQNNGYIFMDPDTYDQFAVPEKALGGKAKYLKAGETFQVMYFEGKPVSVEFPNSMIFEVVYADPGFKGNTVGNVLKNAQMDGGFTVKVPTFIKKGTKVKVDTRTGSYISKA